MKKNRKTDILKPSAEYIKLCGVADEDTGKYKKSFIGKGELLFMADKIIENNQVTVSSVHTTGMKKRETVWYFLYLQEKSALWKKRPIKQRQIRFFWMAIYAKHRFTGKHLLEERLQIC